MSRVYVPTCSLQPHSPIACMQDGECTTSSEIGTNHAWGDQCRKWVYFMIIPHVRNFEFHTSHCKDMHQSKKSYTMNLYLRKFHASIRLQLGCTITMQLQLLFSAYYYFWGGGEVQDHSIELIRVHQCPPPSIAQIIIIYDRDCPHSYVYKFNSMSACMHH